MLTCTGYGGLGTIARRDELAPGGPKRACNTRAQARVPGDLQGEQACPVHKSFALLFGEARYSCLPRKWGLPTGWQVALLSREHFHAMVSATLLQKHTTCEYTRHPSAHAREGGKYLLLAPVLLGRGELNARVFQTGGQGPCLR